MIKEAEVNWKLNSYCEFDCVYCPGQWRGGTLDKTLDQYLHIVDSLQNTRYKEAEKIKWIISGGEPLHFPNLSTILQKIKSKNSYVRLETSGGDSWFNLMEIADCVDDLVLTHHYWQNVSVLNFIIDLCKDKNIKLKIIVPLMTGKILENKELIATLKSQGLEVEEKKLSNTDYSLWQGYTREDINLMAGRRADEDAPVVHSSGPVLEPVKGPVYQDLTKPPVDNTPSYTGKMCFAGVDILYIDHNGWAKGSDCNSRSIGNVFETSWLAPDGPHACSITYCRSSKDRRTIRILTDN
jgi:MoaA/NifB/PqqE/SkfB family radical SAM enzyme